MTRNRLRLEALEDRTVPTAAYDPLTGRGVDAAGREFYALTELPDPTVPTPPSQPRLGARDGGTFSLHSRPSAQKVIYLDFDGHTTTGTPWNDQGKPEIVTPAFDLDDDPTTFTDAELARIEGIWRRVAEDYSPFDVDVTTEFPGLERLRNAGGSDTQWGIRVIIGGDGTWWGDVGGISFVGSFDWNADNGCFVFAKKLEGNEKFTAEGISHEVGHTLGLLHHGRTDPREEHYPGHGSGETGWAPIMGVGYFQELTQWSKGEYRNSNNPQDDIAIITTQNGFGFAADDHGNTRATATRAIVLEPTDIRGFGVIERRTDVDFFSFVAGAGPASITVHPAASGGNLDILAELYDSNGKRIASDNPADSTSATLTANLAAGRYFIKIDGVGKGKPRDAVNPGYTDYGSLGQYTFTGTVVAPIPLTVQGVSAIESAAGMVTRVRVTFNVAPDPRTFAAGNVLVTGPAGAPVAVLAFGKANDAGTVWDFLITPQRFAGDGGVRAWIGPQVTSTGAMPLDQDGDGTAGKAEDFVAAAAYQFSSAAPGLIADNGVTDFPLIITRSLSIRDVNVRVNLSHPYISDLQVQLISPLDKVITLFDHHGADGNDLHDTRFDDLATNSLDRSTAPYAGVFRPDAGALADLIGDDAQGAWTLRIIDSFAGAAGQLNSWGLTITTDSARAGAGPVVVSPTNEIGSSVATLISGLELVFAGPMNPATINPADIRVIDPTGLAVRVLTVVPAVGTDNTRFLVATAPWLKAGNYTIQVGPAVADIFGNGLDSNGNGAFLEPADAAASIQTVSNHVFLSRTGPVTLPRGASLFAPITVGSAGIIGDLAVELNIQHPGVGDLKITLVAPNGDRFVLVDHQGGTGANFVRTVFADAAATPIADGTAPFRGDFQPEQSLAPLAGRSAKGTWKLLIEDTGSGTAGTLLSWGLYVRPQ